jgi:hypothetical protein
MKWAIINFTYTASFAIQLNSEFLISINWIFYEIESGMFIQDILYCILLYYIISHNHL